MKGFSILEFLVGTFLFFSILFSGYKAFDSQKDLIQEMLSRTKTEEESNYRLLVLQTILQKSSEKFKADPFLGEAFVFFEDLAFGTEPNKEAFSFAIPVGDPILFQQDFTYFNIPTTSKVSGKKLLLLAGADSTGNYAWNYARVLEITPGAGVQRLKLEFLLKKDPLVHGSLIEVEVHGLAFRDNALFWVSPTGQLEPFFEPIESFRYEWDSPRLKIFWKTGLSEAYLTMLP